MKWVEAPEVFMGRGSPLVEDKNGAYYVLVSHEQLNDLIAKLMFLFELNGDVDQRNALKQETKWRCRDWLDALYRESGYENHNLVPGAQVINLKAIEANK